MRPDKRQFCDLDWSVPNMRYVRVACQLVRTLLSSAEGREYPFFTEFCDGVFSTLLLELGKVSGSIIHTIPHAGCLL